MNESLNSRDSPRVVVQPDPEQAADLAASLMLAWIEDARARRGRADVALAGGSTPRRCYELLVRRLGDWTHVHLWLTDERLVPAKDQESNARLVNETLHPATTGAVLHTVRTDLSLEGARAAYAGDLRAIAAAPDGVPALDVALLGLGEDGHTASLFPDAAALAATDLAVAVADAPKPPTRRISMSLPVLNAARARLLLVTGRGKAWALMSALETPQPLVPASLLQARGTTIVCDAAAASRLTSRPTDRD